MTLSRHFLGRMCIAVKPLQILVEHMFEYCGVFFRVTAGEALVATTIAPDLYRTLCCSFYQKQFAQRKLEFDKVYEASVVYRAC